MQTIHDWKYCTSTANICSEYGQVLTGLDIQIDVRAAI